MKENVLMRLLTLIVMLMLFGTTLMIPSNVVNAEPAPEDLPLGQLAVLAIKDINGFWQQAFAAIDKEYVGPINVVPYSASHPIMTPCGRSMSNNAFYCATSHSIYFDVNFLKRSMNRVGDFAAVTILAHEWGHLVQRELGLSKRLTIQNELQADCFAGAYTKHAAEVGYLEEGDLEEGGVNLLLAGDSEGIPWFAKSAHGQPKQRVNAYLVGFKQGAGGCF
jgi:uncharacterized protein